MDDLIADLAPTEEYDKKCPFPGCETNCRSVTERRRHLQTKHNLTHEAAVEYLRGKGLDV